MLSGYLNDAGCKVYQSPADADLLIVMTAVDSVQRQPTFLIGEDMDLLVLLLYHTCGKCIYHTKRDCKPIFFLSESKSQKTGGRLGDILVAKLKLGATLCDQILFLHAFLGCDPTSRIYCIEKSTSLNHAKKKKNFQDIAGLFLDSASTKDDIRKA
jgi:hypothetical protein